MTYKCTDCITDHMAASGPQTKRELRLECRTQAVPYTDELFEAALIELLVADKIVIDNADDGTLYYDFPASYYDAQL